MQCPANARRIGVILGIVAVALLSGDSVAQSTQPADAQAEQGEQWAHAVQEFTRIAFERDTRGGSTYLARDATIQSFDGVKLRGLAEVFYDVAGAKLVTARAYEHVPQTLASDLAGDIESSLVVPDEQKEQFIPSDSLAVERANGTAAQWVSKSLAAEEGEALVGVVMLWHPKPVGRSTPGPVFMLIRARAGEPHEPAFQITHIVFGSPIKS